MYPKDLIVLGSIFFGKNDSVSLEKVLKGGFFHNYEMQKGGKPKANEPFSLT